MMMRTALAHSPTKERLLDAAERLMLGKGFAATTVDDICEAAKLTKGSFFHYFASKDELGRQLLERFCATGEKLHASFCCPTESDPLKRVLGYIDAAAKFGEDPSTKGCLLGLFSQELSDTNPTIRDACAKGFEGWKRQFAQELAKAKAAHPLAGPVNPEELAEHFIAILEGALILSKAQQDPAVIGRSLRHFKRYVESLFTKR
jgi:TetR/AcrR family transcriptional repressor of nem operon